LLDPRNQPRNCSAGIGRSRHRAARILRRLCAKRTSHRRETGTRTDARQITQIYEGTNQINRMVIARNLLK